MRWGARLIKPLLMHKPGFCWSALVLLLGRRSKVKALPGTSAFPATAALALSSIQGHGSGVGRSGEG